MQRDERSPLFGDPGLFEGDPCKRSLWHAFFGREQEALVIDPQCRDARSGRALEHVGGIETSPEPHFDHAGIGRDAGELGERRGDRHLEEARGEILADVEHFDKQLGEPFVIDQFARDADALVVAHEVRAGGDMHVVSFGFEHRAQEGAGRTLAVGTRDVERRGQAQVRIAEPIKQRADRCEPQSALGHRQAAQPV